MKNKNEIWGNFKKMDIQTITSIISVIMFVIFTILGIINLKKDKVVSYAFFTGCGLCVFYWITQIFS